MVPRKRFEFEMNDSEDKFRKIQNKDGQDLIREIFELVIRQESTIKYLRDGLNECKQRLNELEKK